MCILQIFVVYIYVVGTVFVIYWEVVNFYCSAEKPADDPTRLEHICISNGYTNGVAPQSTEKRHMESTSAVNKIILLRNSSFQTMRLKVYTDVLYNIISLTTLLYRSLVYIRLYI